MGCWGSGPFDSDTAADFAYEVQEADGAGRVEKVRKTMSEYLDATEEELRVMEGYELDGRIERAVAAAAYVTDGHTGRCQYADTVYARGVRKDADDNDFIKDSWGPPVEVEVDEVTHTMAQQVLNRAVHSLIMVSDTGREYGEMMTQMLGDLTSPPAEPVPAPAT